MVENQINQLGYIQEKAEDFASSVDVGEPKARKEKRRRRRRRRATDIDTVIGKCVQEIWAEYDDDNSGSLDKEETREFM